MTSLTADDLRTEHRREPLGLLSGRYRIRTALGE
jgi:hypothetical protein